MEQVRKNSKKREAILKTIQNTETHPTAEWIYNQLKPEIKDLSLGTVYRNLALFVENGDIVKVTSVDNQERYDAKLTEHSHFICENCGCVIDIDTPIDDENLITNLNLKHGFSAHKFKLNVYGQCNDCVSKQLN